MLILSNVLATSSLKKKDKEENVLFPRVHVVQNVKKNVTNPRNNKQIPHGFSDSSSCISNQYTHVKSLFLNKWFLSVLSSFLIWAVLYKNQKTIGR